MSHALVLKPQLVIDYALSAKDEQIPRSDAGAHPSLAKPASFFFQQEGPGRCQFRDKGFRGDRKLDILATDRVIWAVIKLVLDRQLVLLVRSGLDPTLVVSDASDVSNQQPLAR